jgi:small-conductance mechanosensitive channel
MKNYEILIIETVITIIVFIVSLNFIKKLIEQTGLKFSYHKTRIKILKKIISFGLYLTLIGLLTLIWGVEQSDLLSYVASLLTIFGIAFLAQWSILSNITASLIIFFNHKVNIGDSIVIIDKDYHVEGKISDVGIFFVVIKTPEQDYVSMPTNVFMQKMVKKITKKE